MDGSGKLSDKRRRFVEEYLVDCNATKAAIRAGYGERGAQRTGYRLKNIPEIRAALDAAFAQRREQAAVDRGMIVRELSRIAFADIAEFAGWDDLGLSFKNAGQLSREQTACVAEVAETGTGGAKRLRIKLHSKIKALEALCRLLGLYEDRQEGRAVINVISEVPGPGPGAADASDGSVAADGETAPPL